MYVKCTFNLKVSHIIAGVSTPWYGNYKPVISELGYIRLGYAEYPPPRFGQM
jgi:hypothetical protein